MIPAANPPMPKFVDNYVLRTVDAAYMNAAVKPKQFINLDQSECVNCAGCEDICPWKCIWYVSTDAVETTIGADQPGLDPTDNGIFIIDDSVCTRCSLCILRCPTGVITLGEISNNPPSQGDVHGRRNSSGAAYGMNF